MNIKNPSFSFKAISFVIFISVLWLTAIQGIFYSLQKAQVEEITSTIQHQLRQELNTDNSRYITAAITDLVNLELLRCPILKKGTPPRVILDLSFKGGCSTSFLFLNGLRASIYLQALNGEPWLFQFTTRNKKQFYISLWLSRVLGLVLIFFGWLMFNINSRQQKNILSLEQKNSEHIKQISKQVGHDIRSPLTALRTVISKSESLTAVETKLLSCVYERIEQIAKDLLLTKNNIIPAEEVESVTNNSKIKLNSQWLFPQIEKIISEKKMVFIDRPIQFKFLVVDYFLTARIDIVEFNRVISNLLENACESITQTGLISISLTLKDNQPTVTISDTGKGIPKNILPKLRQQGATFGKKNGNGLGIFHAQQTLNNLGGDLSIDSTEGKGTIVTITLPSTTAPPYLISELDLKSTENIFIIDDDLTILKIWEQKFKSTKAQRNSNYSISYVKKPLKLPITSDPIFQKKIKPYFFLDYRFTGSSITGIDIAKRYATCANIILVTTEYDDEDLVSCCIENKWKILPKPLIEALSIN